MRGSKGANIVYFPYAFFNIVGMIEKDPITMLSYFYSQYYIHFKIFYVKIAVRK